MDISSTSTALVQDRQPQLKLHMTPQTTGPVPSPSPMPDGAPAPVAVMGMQPSVQEDNDPMQTEQANTINDNETTTQQSHQDYPGHVSINDDDDDDDDDDEDDDHNDEDDEPDGDQAYDRESRRSTLNGRGRTRRTSAKSAGSVSKRSSVLYKKCIDPEVLKTIQLTKKAARLWKNRNEAPAEDAPHIRGLVVYNENLAKLIKAHSADGQMDKEEAQMVAGIAKAQAELERLRNRKRALRDESNKAASRVKYGQTEWSQSR